METLGIDIEKLNKVNSGELPATTRVGYATISGNFMAVFVKQDKETGAFKFDKAGGQLFALKPQVQNRRKSG